MQKIKKYLTTPLIQKNVFFYIFRYQSSINERNTASPQSPLVPQISVTDHNTTTTDNRLAEWLQGLGVDEASIERVCVYYTLLNEQLLPQYLQKQSLMRSHSPSINNSLNVLVNHLYSNSLRTRNTLLKTYCIICLVTTCDVSTYGKDLTFTIINNNTLPRNISSTIFLFYFLVEKIS